MKNMLVAAGVLATLLGSVAIAQTADQPAAADDATESFDDMGPGMWHDMDPGMGGPLGGMLGGFHGVDFAMLDTDGDGEVTEADLAARAAARFAQADADGSGGLTAAEMVAMAEAIRAEQMAARLSERLARIDDSADGEVQLEELQARMPSAVNFFDHFDADNDGAVSAEEFAAAQAQMAEMREDRGPRQGWGFWNRDGDDHGPRHRN